MDFTRLAVGLSNGTSVVLSFSNSTPRILYRQPRVTDASLQNLSNDAMVLPTPKPRKVSKLDSYLRSFEYHNALSYTLQNEQANGLIPVLVELTRRGSLKQALSGRTEVDLIPLLDVITHKLCVPRYSSVLLEAAFEVVEIYSNVIGQSKLFDTSLKRLCQSIMRQVRVQKSLIHLEGALSLLESVNRQMLSNH